MKTENATGCERRDCTAFVALLAVMAIVWIVAYLCGGCANTPSGVRVVASSATATTVGDINWDEYKIPVFSVYTGPKVTVWINRDYIALKRMAASGCVTNDTAAFGVYTSQEQKQTSVELEFQVERFGGCLCATNAPAVVRRSDAGEEM